MNAFHLETSSPPTVPALSNTGDCLFYEDSCCAGSRHSSSGKDFTQTYLEQLKASRLKRPPSHL